MHFKYGTGWGLCACADDCTTKGFSTVACWMYQMLSSALQWQLLLAAESDPELRVLGQAWGGRMDGTALGELSPGSFVMHCT